MIPDLEGLEISRGELKHLSGLGINRVYRPATVKKLFHEALKTLLAMGLVLLSYGILIGIFPADQTVLVVIHAIACLGLIVDDALKIITTWRHKSLIAIWMQVERYNRIIHAIAFCDQLENAGNPTAKVTDRSQILSALKMIREELVRTLNTEAMIRRNRSLIKQSSHLFPCDVSNLTIPQWQDSTTPDHQMLAEAWDIAMAVEAIVIKSVKLRDKYL
ncbi:hypothetical protein [Arthrospira platensis]|uniref:SMODS and SLOG-associating 2TM effector domain-containing protein n=1 Tax=Limnospira platensis NIES-46 TaxID=1236695 RepID=A0A5M3T3X7_LIMPL|nr:hypothetical protein [Arthrospira platensis]AMW29082.1 hypothetical protein AP285_15045 [Arthrospira platensis YZ]KDR55056.1 hypothetical protein APPUASWS_024865 [Arthrospira platensis str. Paraca]MBD2667794.1 hypothetical protein [Arthrospira platensis FACHB-439]MBD2708605.1 hypothetical protein [Arthrospira platensis FACHB-835]MDF2212908.1 hypothetical protein [Arthrospira platensis NCB002]MDT9183701.1 hypothetical protein [Limnospira sp. PMC 289.06]MDT9293895.1 hypothetical protein [Ar